MRSIELFSGCGGLALGLARAGFEHQIMIEWDEDAVATVLHNRKRGIQHIRHWPLEHADVRTVDWKRFAGRLDLVAGGSKKPHPDLVSTKVTISSGKLDTRRILRLVQIALGSTWQVTKLPGYVIVYKESKLYPHSTPL